MPPKKAMLPEAQLATSLNPLPGVVSLSAISIPTPLFFRNSLLTVLAEQVGLEPNVLVPCDRTLQLKIIREAGFDPDNLIEYGTPEEGWRLEGLSPVGFILRVFFCYAYLHRTNTTPLTIAGTRGQWGLTEEGIALARPLVEAKQQKIARSKPKKKVYCNGTAEFIDTRIHSTGGLQGSFMQEMRLAVGKKLPVSYASQQVEDHIQTCFTKLIFRDSLTPWLAAGNPVENRHIAMFIIRSAFSESRDSGRNPICRELYGARTESERKKGVVLGAITDSRVIWSGEDHEGQGHWEDLRDDAATPEEDMIFASMMDRIHSVIRERKPSVADRYIGIFEMRSQGLSLKEIAEQENVTSFRAAALMTEVRRVLRLGHVDTELGIDFSDVGEAQPHAPT